MRRPGPAAFWLLAPAVLLVRGPAGIDKNPATLTLFGVEREQLDQALSEQLGGADGVTPDL